MNRTTTPIERHGITARYAEATVYNGLVHAVEVPPDTTGDIRDQTRTLLESLEKTLHQTGSGLDRLLMATIYLTDMDDYAGMNQVWEAMLPQGCAPARACVQVAALASPEYKVEIAVMAVAST